MVTENRKWAASVRADPLAKVRINSSATGQRGAWLAFHVEHACRTVAVIKAERGVVETTLAGTEGRVDASGGKMAKACMHQRRIIFGSVGILLPRDNVMLIRCFREGDA